MGGDKHPNFVSIDRAQSRDVDKYSGYLLYSLLIVFTCIPLVNSLNQYEPIQQQQQLQHNSQRHHIYHRPTLSSTTSAAVLAYDEEQSSTGWPSLSSVEGESSETIFIERVADLDHLSYLLLRNYNLTDEGLVQSSWLMGLGAAQGSHKQHQEAGADGESRADGNESRDRLALMLESFILHLRNGHLKRMSNELLEQTVVSYNLSDSFAELKQRRVAALAKFNLQQSNIDARKAADSAVNETLEYVEILDANEIRCLQLVTLYKYDLHGRHEPEGSFVSNSKVVSENSGANSNESSAVNAPMTALSDDESRRLQSSSPNETTRQASPKLDDMRLLKLCKLAVTCHSADELVELISAAWRDPESRGRIVTAGDELSAERVTKEGSGYSELERDTSLLLDSSSLGPDEGQELKSATTETGDLNEDHRRSYPKSLRDSLSLSLAKLCPLVLFPLHEEDGQCSLRRDDRPSMISVWGFATLFVTIVCFCSLIGLSITPLINHPVQDSLGNSDASEHPEGPPHQITQETTPWQKQQVLQNERRRYRASLTLFEGLAVGSLVGSALFSLIPQAFELHERESNHSFLLKAFIIFSGIYLFFCSERIMRIILDTRQMRKRKKRKTRQSSTTAAGGIDQLVPATNEARCDTSNNLPWLSSSISPTNTSLQKIRSVNSASDRVCRKERRGQTTSVAPDYRAKGIGLARSDQAEQPFKRQKLQSQPQQPKSMYPGTESCCPEHGLASGFQSDRLQRLKVADSRESGALPRSQETSTRRAAVNKRKSQNLASRQAPGRQGATRAQHHHSSARTKASHRSQQQFKLSGRQRRQKRQTQLRVGGELRNEREAGKVPGICGGGMAAGRTRRAALMREAGVNRGRVGGADSDVDDYYHRLHQSGADSTSTSTSASSSSSFSSYKLDRPRVGHSGLLLTRNSDDSQVDYSSSSSSSETSCCRTSLCGSCDSYDFHIDFYTNNDSDDDNTQARAVSKQMNEISRRLAAERSQPGSERSQALRTSLKFDDLKDQIELNSPDRRREEEEEEEDRRTAQSNSRPVSARSSYRHGRTQKEQDISTVAWMIVLGDGLHNFIDGISIGAAFSESILSGVSISVAVICEEFPHELGDFAVLVSAGMTIRQALGYNFLSACTCYIGMAVGIILGDVTDGASYISALAAGVFLYIALVDMMGELSATLEASSRDSIGRTLKLFLLQNVGIFIGISIIFVLSFIDF